MAETKQAEDYGNVDELLAKLEQFEPLECEHCECNDGYFVVDPYQQDVGNITIIRVLCDKCEQECANDI